MVTQPLYQRGRLSAPITGPHGERPGRADYDLIAHLRQVRTQGDDAMTAAEQHDPDFSVKLSACKDVVDANELLDAWLEHRVTVLKQVQADLRRVWEAAQKKCIDEPQPLT